MFDKYLQYNFIKEVIIMSLTLGIFLIHSTILRFMVFATGLIDAPSRPCRFPGNKTRNAAVKKNSQPGLPIGINSSYLTLQSQFLTAENITRQALNFFSEETAVLSGNMRSLDYLLLFDQTKVEER